MRRVRLGTWVQWSALLFFLVLWVSTWLITASTWERDDAGHSVGMSSIAIPLHFVLPFVFGGLVGRSRRGEAGTPWKPYTLAGLAFGVAHLSILWLVDVLWLPKVESDPSPSELAAEALAFAAAYAIICAVLSTVGGIVWRILARIRHGGDGALESPDAMEEL